MEKTHITFDISYTIFKIILKGELLSGSDGNSQVQRIKEIIREKHTLCEDRNNILFDFTELKYDFGDSIYSIFLDFLSMKKKVAIIANSDTKKNLESLIKSTIHIPIYQLEKSAIEYFKR